MNDVATGKITPIIVVHAVTAGGLRDHYPMDSERVWSPWEMVTKDYDRITLYPYEKPPASLMRYEAVEPALVRPYEAFGLIYKDLVSELKHNLSHGPVPVQPVYPFVYDWRQDNLLNARVLRAFVQEVIDRTNLMKHHPLKDGAPVCDCVDLIGHSMGGLVIAGAIADGAKDNWAAACVRRVVTLGTPFRGANASIQKLATGGGTMFGRDSKERERTMARVTPSVYQLLPSFPGAVVEADGTESDIFLPATFQPSILDTIEEFIEARIADQSLTKPGQKAERKRMAEALFTNMLDTSWKFRRLTDSVTPAMLRPHDGAWLALVGAGEKTLVKTGITKDPYGKRYFNFEGDDKFSPEDNKWTPAKKDKSGKDISRHTGDETVPLSGAIPPWKDSWRNTVVVMRKDFEWLGEIGDRVLCDQAGFHSSLPLLDLAQRWIINFLRPEWASKPSMGQHGKLWGRGLPGFPTASPDGIATTAERRAVWNDLIPEIKLSDVA